MRRYVITGTDRDGKRFKIETSTLAYALAHNVYNGTLWELLDNGKRKRIKMWYN